MFFLDFIRRIKAPDWFVEDWNRTDQLQKEINGLIGVNVETMIEGLSLQEGIVKAMETAQTMIKKGAIPNPDKLQRADIISHYREVLIAYCWAKFRYENQDTSFGKCQSLHYDPKSQLIEIKK